jgi:hypothetical protein
VRFGVDNIQGPFSSSKGRQIPLGGLGSTFSVCACFAAILHLIDNYSSAKNLIEIREHLFYFNFLFRSGKDDP